jgi:hypothetical protein
MVKEKEDKQCNGQRKRRQTSATPTKLLIEFL